MRLENVRAGHLSPVSLGGQPPAVHGMKQGWIRNNLGYSQEKEDEWEKALGYYSQAANLRSSDAVIVTVNPKWRGKGISEVAGQNAENLRKLMAKQETAQAKVARLNLQGVLP